MIKYNETEIIYSSAPYPPEGIHMDRTYTIFKKNEKLYITDGNVEIKSDESTIKMLFIPKGKNLTWKDINFAEDVKEVKYEKKYHK